MDSISEGTPKISKKNEGPEKTLTSKWQKKTRGVITVVILRLILKHIIKKN